MEPSLLEIQGAREQGEAKYTSLATIRFIGGLETQRSYFASIDTRYNQRYLGGKPDALIAGSNVEVSNKLTLQRRPGLVPYGVTSIPAPIDFFEWQQAAPPNITLVVDTASAVYNYSPTHAGIYFNKSVGSGQTNFFNIVDTLYAGDGVDLYKITGPNLLTQSNTFGTGSGTSVAVQSPWIVGDVFSFTGGQSDPSNGTEATQIIWSNTGAGAFLEQDVVPNYTPIASNTFTYSVWMKETGGAISIDLEIADQSGSIVNTTFALTSTWTKYQVTATMGAGSNVIKVLLHNPTTTNAMVVYGEQLEVGGPASPTRITTTQPEGVWNWGIQGPAAAPLAVPSTTALGNLWQPNTHYNIGDVVTDQNGNTETAVTAGTSGGAQPPWSLITGAITPDGTQNTIEQSQTGLSATNAVSVPLQNPVLAGDTLLAFIAVYKPGSLSISDTQSNTWTLVNTASIDSWKIYMYTVRSAAAGLTTVNISGGGAQLTWMGVAEISDLTGLDQTATNTASDSYGGGFNSGLVSTTHALEMLVSFVMFGASASGVNYPTTPLLFTPLVAQSNITSAFSNVAAAFEYLTTTLSLNPQWGQTTPGAGTPNRLLGITASFQSSIGTLTWKNTGPIGLTSTTGYQYYYAFMNSITGHVSNVSPISVITGPVIGQSVTLTGVGMQITPSGPLSQDPQVDTIVIFRNVSGGGFWYQLATLPNPGTTSAAETWTYVDTTLDSKLNTSIYAPVGLLNSPPPAGLINMEYFGGRLFGSVANDLYYNTSTDNASLLNITQNGVPPESWAPGNVQPFNSPLVRNVATATGMLIFTKTDTWLEVGSDLSTFTPVRAFPGIGIESYNALAIDGSQLMVYTGDRQILTISPSSGAIEAGFAIGDVVESTFSPANTYIARHIAGSSDNAFYLADGSTGWYRLNPNQVGASVSGEQTAVWSPFATIVGGCGAIASVETSSGVHQLLVGQTGPGVVLTRSLGTFTDNGSPYTWSATIGSILLAMPGKLAETESITTEYVAATSAQPTVAVLLDEITGAFETLPISVNDPPQLAPSISVLSNRFYLSQGTVPPICRHMQVQLSGSAANRKDELLSLCIRGALIGEQV